MSSNPPHPQNKHGNVHRSYDTLTRHVRTAGKAKILCDCAGYVAKQHVLIHSCKTPDQILTTFEGYWLTIRAISAFEATG
ncbi:hypothetical protein CFAM422_009068 [Trichoderma lentiforme]|uniref:Uncharacterized protein n=1 Tax=Trichoderma lentiforme TaxID=1567552 RepID=A0A9P5C9G4_9HYPO|nr:hypothetical protein CFAM422_009068 [Trichoderma lentiforme]